MLLTPIIKTREYVPASAYLVEVSSQKVLLFREQNYHLKVRVEALTFQDFGVCFHERHRIRIIEFVSWRKSMY